MELAGLRVRLASMAYEALLLIALLLPATAVFVAVFGDSRLPPWRTALQLYLLASAGIYLIWSWTGGRRTLAMRTWKIRLASRDGGTVGLRTAVVRYLIAVLGIAAFGAGVLWSVVDPERQFLHDRLAGTRLVRE